MLSEDRSLRDLAWCLHSPPVVIVPGQPVMWPHESWFAGLDRGAPPSPLPQPRDAHHFRLGQHFEALLAAWLAASPAFTLRAANLQVQDGKRTVGEFDLLVEHDGEIEHWEAAVKFYLGTRDGRTLDCWYGPNTSDRFDIKYERLIAHQLQLADNPYAAAILAERYISVSRSRCFMKGRLFHPWERFIAGELQCPEIVNPGHERGWWIPQADFLPAFEDRGYRFVYLPKMLWLSKLIPADFDAPLSCWELQEFLESPHVEQATHVAVVNESGETSRGFIVKNQWLERASC